MLTLERPDERIALADEFRDWIRGEDFPCVGAKAAVARGNLTLVHARHLASAWNDLEIHRAILDWNRARAGDEGQLHSFAVIFDGPGDLSETRFERLMWERLQSLADKDVWLGQSYDDSVSADPQNPHFALSFGGEALFVVGLHPGASRPARRFSRPVLVFNPHKQFEMLREQGKYERMRERILTRDEKLAGSINPMLAEHGTASAARQYSGRAVGEDWVCPFSDKRG
ncbi:guanitoxin biosynthesis heme-dependent pre-guanitoxin N-hydroxylase GntA [Tsuneonella amylolytica]|uniref:guanitoxin biosynthesis heme-dependent pre-guanitoxin N-hydroxylase GntA n=1 Tax=Tsuneonella amylolytica TaxID=2338327 RepID=UPI000EAA88F7|nr:guanitoxin biosynthesis heme-dependent pre-guanitoxin N-hydroxylase GntA [Tsuneonella amylolytica]